MNEERDDERRTFIAEVAAHIFEQMEMGDEVFVVLGFRHNGDWGEDGEEDGEEGTIHCTSATVSGLDTEKAERIEDNVYQIVEAFLDRHFTRCSTQ